jgi:hypothetical protein
MVHGVNLRNECQAKTQYDAASGKTRTHRAINAFGTRFPEQPLDAGNKGIYLIARGWNDRPAINHGPTLIFKRGNWSFHCPTWSISLPFGHIVQYGQFRYRSTTPSIARILPPVVVISS